ncbi:MAG: RecB family exonuclease [bacterium]
MPNYSHSRIETYQNCPRQYKLHYIDKVEIEDVESIEAFLGARVHESLERLYKDVRMTKVPKLEEIIEDFDRAWDENWHDGIMIVRKQYGAENYRKIGRNCLTRYYERYYPFNDATTIATEYRVAFPIDDQGRYWIQGVIDRLAIRKDGTYEIHDYKTSGSLPSQQRVDQDRQLALYQIGVKQYWPDVEQIELIWHYLFFDVEMRSKRTPDDLARVKADVIDLINRIESDTEFRPSEGPLCDWCPYPEFCPAKKHEVLTSKLPVNEYLNEAGVVLVNRYAEIQRSINEYSQELEKVKEALIEYARKNQVEVIKGSDHKAIVRFYHSLSFPRKDEPGRAELDRLVRALGIWDKVSNLDTISLAKMIENKALPEQIASQIASHGRYEEKPWLRVQMLRSDEY